MAFCQHCGMQLSDNSVFCGGCGTKQESRQQKKTCPKCGAEALADMMFCDKCGTRYSERPIATQPQTYYYTLVFSREEQFFFGDTAIEIYVDDEKLPNTLHKSGNVVKVPLPAGRHFIKLTNPSGVVRTFIARVTEFYMDIQRDDIRISVTWNRVSGKIDARADGYPIQYKCHK